MKLNSNPFFSIIVPVYNVVEYIENTVKSVLSQSYDDFELILIDDGSTDGSGEYIDEIAASDCRIRSIHQENAGVSAARNHGIKLAVGDWVIFVDGDDALVNNALEVLKSIIDSNPSTDLIGYGYNSVSKIELNTSFKEHYKIKVFDCSLIVPFNALDHYTVWSEAVRRDIIEGLRFEALKNGEDVLFCNKIACVAKYYIETDAKLYKYLQRQSSAKRNAWTERRFEDFAVMNEKIIETIKSCQRDVDPIWLKRWIGSIIIYTPELWKQRLDIQRKYMKRHIDLIKSIRRSLNLPKYLNTWLRLVSYSENGIYYRLTAMLPMRLYSNLKG